MVSGKQRIGLYGGTFNPVHYGHIAATKSFLQSKKIDSLWILLNPDPPHKPNETFAPYSVRLSMLEDIFKSNSKVKVSDVETQLPTPGYTIQTLRYLISKHPVYTFYWCIGFDSFIEFHHWYKWEAILERCELLVVDRPEDGGEQANEKVKAHAEFVSHSPVSVSSSEIRKRIPKGQTIDKLVPPSVLKRIKDQNLYQKRG